MIVRALRTERRVGRVGWWGESLLDPPTEVLLIPLRVKRVGEMMMPKNEDRLDEPAVSGLYVCYPDMAICSISSPRVLLTHAIAAWKE
jgi:hypothetical protein